MNIVITGASGGIGQAIASALAHHETTLHLVGRDEAGLCNASKDVEDLGGRCVAYRHDLSSESGRQAFCQALLEKTFKIDWVIHAAGMIDAREPELALDEAAAAATFAINTLAPISLTRLLSPDLKEEGGMLYVSSTAGLWGNERFPVYSASKAALIAFARAMAKRWKSAGTTSIALCPGPTDTAMTRGIGTDPEKLQPVEAVAQSIRRIIRKESPYNSGDVVIVRDGVEKLHAE